MNFQPMTFFLHPIRSALLAGAAAVLPLPLAPRKPNISPFETSNEIWSTAVKSPNFLVSPSAVITLSELLAEEYKEQGIAFNVLALGAVQTEMLAEAFPGYQAPISAADMAKYIVDFTLTGNQYYNGKVLEVSSSNP